MRGVPRERPRDLEDAGLVGLDAEQAGRAVQDRHEVGDVVVVEVAGEAEPVAQRRREQAGAGRGPDDGEGRQLERDGGGAGPLADDDVDPEVLHREVEHLLGGAGSSGGSRRGRAPRPRRARTAPPRGRRRAGSPGPLVMRSGALELGGDDHRERRLAQPGRTRTAARGRAAPAPPAPPRARGRAGRAPAAVPGTRRAAGGAAPPRRRARRRSSPASTTRAVASKEPSASTQPRSREAPLGRPGAHGRSSRSARRR